jgi:hypothetical protein
VFAVIRSEVATRHLATRQWYGAVATAPAPAPVVSKGLVFVQNYALYEYSLVSSLAAALATAKTHGLTLNDVRHELLALILSSEFDSAADSSQDKRWSQRIELFRRVRCHEQIGAGRFEGIFPTDGSHFRTRQLETIWSLLGIAVPIVATPRHRGRIDEMVEHRNAIAHGRESPDVIGRRFSEAEIHSRIDDTAALCVHIIDTLEIHSRNPANLRA